MSEKIQSLLEQANYSDTNDTSVSSAKRSFSSEQEAGIFFGKIKNKLLNLSNWNENSTPSSYELFDETGRVSEFKSIETGKFIRITVHGSGKYDWVGVLNIHDAEEEFVITVSPTFDPTADPVDKTVISHFFKDEATNNFCLQKDDKSVALYVIGLNEKANIKESANPLEAARNAAAANLGYYLGLQKTMWTEFCKNFLETDS